MNENTRQQLKYLLRTREFFQDIRIKSSNFLELRKDGSKTDSFGTAKIYEESIPRIVDIINDCIDNENAIAKQIDEIVINDDMWKIFFKSISGIGSIGAAYLLAYIDINKASTRARINQYCGLNPSLVRAKKYNTKTKSFIVTDVMIKGDKMASGYMCPYNKYLKPKLYGIICDGIIKHGTKTNKETGEIKYTKYYNIYLNRKNRTRNSNKPISEGSDKLWCNESKAHIDMDARRIMLKEMLSDFYETYRKLEGLEVRVRYEEEYLGRKHHA